MNNKVFQIVVLAKQVPDTHNVGKDAMKEDGTINRAALPAIFNPDDLKALEMALACKDALKDIMTVKVSVITMGPTRSAEIIRESMFRGADNGFVVSDKRFAGSDTLATSYILSQAVKKFKPDLVFCGRQAIDGDTAQTGPQIGEKLDCAVVTYLEKLDLDGDTATAVRDIGTGVETCRAKLPALFTVTEKFGELRPYEMRRVMKYKNAEPTILDCAAIGCEDDRCGFAGSPTSVNKIESVVLAGGEFKEVAATDEGIGGLVSELIKDHTIG